MTSKSKVQLAGVQQHECGYCKANPEGSVSYGFVSPSMLVSDYEYLMLHGWRRSGSYFYKPLLHRSCCPAYTIRLKVDQFQPTKSQKKVLRRAHTRLNHQNEEQDQKKRKTEHEDNEEPEIDITVETEPASFSQEKYELYKKYQITVHNDKEEELSEKGFTRFLVESPLVDNRKPKTDLSSSAGLRYGTYHQLYRLQRKLVAVGVLDLVPSGLSSVYCFYDVDHRDLVLGKFTALKEIEFCQQNRLSYYYMGFYIHSCEKMRYKGEFHPSELLCCKTNQFVPLSECVPLLDQFKFTPFVSPYKEQRAALSLSLSLSPKDNDNENKEKEGKEEEEEKEDLLSQFFFPDPDPDPDSSSPSLPVEKVPLDLGRDDLPTLSINRLSEEFRSYFTPILEEWIEIAGNEIASRVQVMLS
jgi:arginine-tRNA-protein transferase